MMDSSPSKMNTLPNLPSTTAGTKRPAPTLLPAFEPLSSSPFQRASKRRAQSPPSGRAAYEKYPTPVPTSATGILSSSPPRVHARSEHRRPAVHRTQSSVSERAPLSAVPTVVLSDDGSELLMGRSSNSSHYQLSANRLISRVHVKVRYIAATMPLEPNKVEIICNGWNGVKLHCQGRTWELAKGDSFTSETENAEIMLDVQDARVLIAWPRTDRKELIGLTEDSTWDDENSPVHGITAVNSRGQLIQSSPLRRNDQRIRSPESPTPAGGPTSTNLADLITDNGEETFVRVYEDDHSAEEEDPDKENSQRSTEVVSKSVSITESQSSDLSDPEDEDPDEENDPFITSFGPFGANLSSRMASFTAAGSPSPEQPRRRRPSPPRRTDSESTNEADPVPIVNHVVNQLAFSRLSSTPLSVIMNNLPTELKGGTPTRKENRGITNDDLRKMLNAARCIGEIQRAGKDAAGKALESEYYYIPDEDQDEQRRAAVVDGLRKPSLRNCRKQHKQYYWKKPRTP